MADLPVDAGGSGALMGDLPAADSHMARSFKKGFGSDLFEGFNNLNLIRQVSLMTSFSASVAIGFAIVLWMNGHEYRPLYSSMTTLESGEVIQILEDNDLLYKMDSKSGVLMVAAEDIHTARLKLAAAEITGDTATGFELLDQEQPIGTSQFMEQTRYRRSLEGELAKTISAINAIKSARVHLAIPKQSVFVRDARTPRASVFIDVYPGRPVKQAQIRAIANLVASSIPELMPKEVTIVDQKGNLLSVKEENPELLLADQHLEYTKKIEKELLDRIHVILEPVVGIGNFKAEISADVDFTQVEQTDEVYNPDLPAIRSEETLEEYQGRNGAATGVPGALTNQPPGTGRAPEQLGGGGADGTDAFGNRTIQTAKNYELDRTISYTRHQVGNIKRLTVAVVVNDIISKDPETGEKIYTAIEQEQIDRLALLVRNVIGFSAMRGDSVHVINSRFVSTEIEEVEVPFYETDIFMLSLKYGLGFLLILVIILGLLRPVYKSLVEGGRRTREEFEARELAELEGGDDMDTLSDDSVTLTGGESLLLPSPEEGYEQQLNAVKGLIAEDSGRVAQVVKKWIAEKTGNI